VLNNINTEDSITKYFGLTAMLQLASSWASKSSTKSNVKGRVRRLT